MKFQSMIKESRDLQESRQNNISSDIVQLREEMSKLNSESSQLEPALLLKEEILSQIAVQDRELEHFLKHLGIDVQSAGNDSALITDHEKDHETLPFRLKLKMSILKEKL